MDSSEIGGFGLFLIESLSENDKKTGKILSGEIIKYKKFQEENLYSVLIQVLNKKKFLAELDDIIYKVREENYFPILHIEAHGSDKGITLASDELLTWEQLFEKTRELNVLLKNYLIIILGMCKGLAIISEIDPSKRAPFKAVIGAVKDIGDSDLILAFEEFYNHYFFSFSPHESVEKMNLSLGGSNPSFYVLFSDNIFDKIVDPNRAPDNLNRHINEIANSEKATNPKYFNVEYNIVRAIVEKKIKMILKDAANSKDYFIMTDLLKK